jgi:hypothetical protein
MYNSPITGNDELDAFLFDIKSAIEDNANASVVSVDNGTGIITAPTAPSVVGYLYRYLSVKYADNTVGGNISDNPTAKNYFGIYNSEFSVESLNPADYTWYLAAGGFGSTSLLWILNQGGRQVTFTVAANVPDDNTKWQLAPSRSLDLDKTTKEYSQYMSIRYAQDVIGTGFSTSPINALYYGVTTNDTSVASLAYQDYEWSPTNFSTDKEIYYRSFGGRNIGFKVDTFKPSGYIQYSDAAIINLDVNTLSAVNSIGIVSDFPLVIEAPFRYLLLRYADDINGGGITTNPLDKQFFGLQASSVLTVDSNPADYIWFNANSKLITDNNLWTRISGNTVSFYISIEAPDISGWQNALVQNNTFEPYLDVYVRSGIVVSTINSPVDGRLYNSIVGANGITTLSLAPFGQGSTTNGFTIDPANTNSISVDQFGRITQTGTIDEIRFSSTITTATSGQTLFSFTNNQPDQILVFRNGVFLYTGTDYSRTNLSVTLNNPCALGDTISLYYVRLIDATTSSDKVPFTNHTMTLGYNQTIINTTYIDGTELLFLNGVLLVDSEYSYIGINQGYLLATPATTGKLDIITFSILNSNKLIFGENYAETFVDTTNVVFPTAFNRNSTLIFLNGALLRPTSDYSIPGGGDLASNYTLLGGQNLSGQPTQFCTFNSSGPASMGSVGAMAVAGYDLPVVIDHKPTMLDMFQEMQSQINGLNEQLFYLRNQNVSSN